MISTLHIKNIGIIGDLIVNLNNGLNILTGETGAGKTLIIDSLQIATGGRYNDKKNTLLLNYHYIYQIMKIQLMEILLFQEKFIPTEEIHAKLMEDLLLLTN